MMAQLNRTHSPMCLWTPRLIFQAKPRKNPQEQLQLQQHCWVLVIPILYCHTMLWQSGSLYLSLLPDGPNKNHWLDILCTDIPNQNLIERFVDKSEKSETVNGTFWSSLNAALTKQILPAIKNFPLSSWIFSACEFWTTIFIVRRLM